jgi:hypothetical protein
MLSARVISGVAAGNATTSKTVSEFPGDSCQDARVADFVDSSVDARVGVASEGGFRPGPFLPVVTVKSSPVRAWICRWMAAGFRSL